MGEDSQVEYVEEARRVPFRFPILLLALVLIFLGILIVAISLLGRDNVTGVLFVFPFPFVIVGGKFDPTFFIALSALFLVFPLLIFYYFLRKMSHE